MRYFVLCCVFFIIGGFAQTQVQSETVLIDDAQFFSIDEKDQINNLDDQQDSNQNKKIQIESSANVHQQQHKPTAQNQKFEHHKKHYKRGHPKMSHSDHNQFLHSSVQQTPQLQQKHPYIAHQQRDSIYSQQNYEQSEDNDEQRLRTKNHKKFWNKKSFKHIAFFIILVVVAFFLVRKCVTKRNCENGRRLHSNQQNFNPVMIDQEIQRHFAEIQRLQQLKSSIEAQRRQLQEQPIIYQEPHPEQLRMNNSLGRMVDENCYPRNFEQNIPMQNIPVGVPILIENPYNQPQVYRNF